MAFAHQIGGPVGGRALRAEPVGHLLVGVAVGIEVDQGRFAAAAQITVLAGDGLEDRPGDGVVAADGDWISTRSVEAFEVRLHVLDADVVDHGFRQGHVAHIVDATDVPGDDAEGIVCQAIEARNVAHGPGRQMLVALGRAVAR